MAQTYSIMNSALKDVGTEYINGLIHKHTFWMRHRSLYLRFLWNHTHSLRKTGFDIKGWPNGLKETCEEKKNSMVFIKLFKPKEAL